MTSQEKPNAKKIPGRVSSPAPAGPRLRSNAPGSADHPTASKDEPKAVPAVTSPKNEAAPNRMRLMVSVAMIFGGCMTAIIAMEYVLVGDRKAGNLLSFTEICFVMLQCLPTRISPKSPSCLKPLVMPLTVHLRFAVMWGTMSILANYAFAYKISVTIFTLIRSCNIIATVLIGRLFYGQRYTWRQLLCTGAVTIGIFAASMGESQALRTTPSSSCTGCSDPPAPAAHDDAASSTDDGELAIWLMGLAMLALCQLLQGLLGHAQSGFYRTYNHLAPKDELCDEFMFTSHFISLVPFLALREDLVAAGLAALASDPVVLPFPLPFPIPSRIAWLVFNSAAQTICLRGVFRTSSIVSPLTLTIILSVRKFLSVLISIYWFSNPWSYMHSVAMVLIFGGAFAYSQAAAVKDEIPSKKNA